VSSTSLLIRSNAAARGERISPIVNVALSVASKSWNWEKPGRRRQRAGHASIHAGIRSMIFLVRHFPERPSQFLVSALQAILDFIHLRNFLLINMS